MTRLLSIVLSALLGAALCFADGPGYAALDGRLDAYVEAISSEPVAVKQKECDFLISSCKDSSVRDHVAVYLYSKYINSAVMGDEAVAVYLTDNWFAPGHASFPSEEDLMMAKVYAGFNRSSLLGSQAPPLLLEDAEGSVTEIDFRDGRMSVLYIYDTSCPECRAESARLSAMLPSCGHELHLVALYTGSDKESWLSYTHRQLPSAEESSLKVSHYWDPSGESDYQHKYGVLSTPRMFLIGGDGIILGRALDTSSLLDLLDRLDAPYAYGEPESMGLLSTLFGGQEEEEYIATIDYLASRGASRDSTMWRHVTGDLLYFFAGRRGEASHGAAQYVADSLVLANPGAWRGEDSLMVLPLARMTSDICKLSPPGSRIAGLKLPGTLIRGGKEKQGSFKTGKTGGEPSIVVFYSEGCEECRAEISALKAKAMLKENKKMTVLLIDLGSLTPSQREQVADHFDISLTPFIIQTDSKGIIQGKYLSFKE